MSKDYLDKWSERQIQNTKIIEKQQAKTKTMKWNKENRELLGVIIHFISWIITGPLLQIVCWIYLAYLVWTESTDLIQYLLTCTGLLYSQGVVNKGLGDE